ncbi:hypothetical protein GT360_11160 [Vibrio astriarenae]|uniref:VWA domain-containing protein n=1 Tax=Vibrio astriarenae TaxID=1481923 RepID=A0A7Z2T4D3_9VIBR|nr:hypothetical protein [Vibrio astriarenae]QIA64031.1 hypothetical protein GT360_11160 [Vibrio astriarenae]
MTTYMEAALQTVREKNAATETSTHMATGVLPISIVIACNQHHQGHQVQKLNIWLERLFCQLQQQPVLMHGLELAVISAHDYPTVHQPMASLESISSIPLLAARGSKLTLAQSLDTALSMLLTRIEEYKQHSLKAKRPWLLIVTDRAGTDYVDDTRARIERYKASYEVIPFVLNFGDFSPALAPFSLGRQINININSTGDINQWLVDNLINVLRTKQGTVHLTPPPQKQAE